MEEKETNPAWQEVISRSLAFMALQASGLREKDLATQGQLLETLGLSRKISAELLGTSPASLTELLRLARNKKGGPRGKAKKK